MRQQHHVVMLAATGGPTSPGEIAALADAEHAAQAVDRELRFRPIDEREPHRLPSRAKKAVAFFRMSRSCRRISFSRRSRFSSAVTSLSAAAGSTARRSRLRPTHRTSVDSPIPRSPAISRCVRPLVCARRTASSSNSFVNRRCCVIEFLIAHWELSTFPKQVHLGFDVELGFGVRVVHEPWPAALGFLFAVVAAGLCGWLIGRLSFRVRGAYFVIVTISFAEVVRLVALNWVELTQGPLALTGIPAISLGLPGLGTWTLRTKVQNYYLVLAVGTLCYLLIARLVGSRFGRAMRGLKENESLALSVSINATRTLTVAAVISAAMAGAAGSLYAHYLRI